MTSAAAFRTSTPTIACIGGILALLLSATPTLAGGVAIVSATLTDNGDNDGFADSNETVSVTLTVHNSSGSDLSGVTARLITETPELVCVTTPLISIGELLAGETRLISSPFVFHVLDVDRTTSGLGPLDPLSARFRIAVDALPLDQLAIPEKLILDLDLDVAAGSGPTSFFESFEGSLGAFEVENLDQGRNTLAASDGYRCQYNDPDWSESNSFGNPDCHLGVSLPHTDQLWWGLSGPAFSPQGGRGFSGFHSLFFGEDLGFPENWTTPTSSLEAVRTSDPIHIGWDAVTPELVFKHQVSLGDSLTFTGPRPGEAIDRGVVMVQLANDAENPSGPWIKIYPYQNAYEQFATDATANCMFDPIDDGSDEENFFDPGDPDRRLGPSSTCFPERVFSRLGETSSPFDAQNLGLADGPGLQGLWGIGTWVESRFDLSRFRGRSIRVRFLSSNVQHIGETWEVVYLFNPTPGEDGWWIDDVEVVGALVDPASVTVDDADNSSLPGPPPADGDTDGFPDICDNCVIASNSNQADRDLDGIGDLCDDCPDDAENIDPDADLFCAGADNCPLIANFDQADADGDGFGSVCDCSDLDADTYPGASEVNDGVDNSCPGDVGYGLTDEIGPTLFWTETPLDNELQWASQSGVSQYQIVRSTYSDFFKQCVFFLKSSINMFDNLEPPAGEVFYYLVRAHVPNVGSWGANSSGTDRMPPCN